MQTLFAVEKTELSTPVQAALTQIDRIAFFTLPLKNKFRKVTQREGLLLHGPAGWAEVSPFWDYDSEESAHWLAAGLEQATDTRSLPTYRNEIPINVTIPVVSPDRAAEIVQEFLSTVTDPAQAVTAKVKVADPGVTLAEDASRLAAVRENLGGRGKIRIDANAAWNEAEAVEAINLLGKAAGGLEYVEQPCATVEELAQVRRRCNVPIAADESVRRASDPLAVARAQAADLLIVKLQPMAGIRRVVEVVEEAGLPAVVSSALDSSVGIASGLRLAASLPSLPFACGLGTARMFTSDVVETPLIPRGGFLTWEEPQVLWQSAQNAERPNPINERITAWKLRLEQMVNAVNYY
ncbi:o-succinylbenzoate synthase [Gleimia sp. 6138-11-ORH1]|uniref:o-succinylbenzoate synthase n=1 Tax=Gleimia sp. 6138-11-ORH1 TaxID=2973937 RepID=UPI00216A1366|nr:o-succinylbenzoate synthase [Gleimia sp. 6138-11-ORH1]MCS4483889.1 o-succinylbenzoate synthase [Gleimia sp. 6138-11-ORH1]